MLYYISLFEKLLTIQPIRILHVKVAWICHFGRKLFRYSCKKVTCDRYFSFKHLSQDYSFQAKSADWDCSGNSFSELNSLFSNSVEETGMTGFGCIWQNWADQKTTTIEALQWSTVGYLTEALTYNCVIPKVTAMSVHFIWYKWNQNTLILYPCGCSTNTQEPQNK